MTPNIAARLAFSALALVVLVVFVKSLPGADAGTGQRENEVTLPSGAVVCNHMRVFSNHNGSEVIFTLYQQPGTTDKEFDDDAAVVKSDLE